MTNKDDYVFGKLKSSVTPPNLIEVQTQSFADFLQADVAATKRQTKGLQAIFKEVFPVMSKDGRFTLDFVRYNLEKPRKSATEALRDGDTFSAPLHATFRLKDGDEVREDNVFLGEVPLMTRDGAFIINGAERVIVSQLHRSPGICSEKAIHANGHDLHSVRIIPDHGSWIEIQFDASDIMWVYLDRRRRARKFYVTTFLRTLGYSTDEDILSLYYTFNSIPTKERWTDDQLQNYVLKDDLLDVDTGSILANRYEPVTPTLIDCAARAKIPYVDVVDTSFDKGLLLKTLKVDQTHNAEEAFKDIYHRLRPGDPVTAANAQSYVRSQFFDPRRYDLGYVGRYKVNQRLKLMDKVDLKLRVLSDDGIEVVEALRLLLDITSGRADVDDIDHLGNRRIRTTGELLENACRTGLARTERLIRERMGSYDPGTAGGVLSPVKLVTSKSLSAVIQDFFGRSQLSQFMDMTNPLSALAHKRRLSALGPGGLSRERAGFEVRDVHPTHYGRICPIETPEGPNIGLISSLGIYARVNRYGFIETPYRVVREGRVTDEILYIDADEEELHTIAQANAMLDAEGRFVREVVKVRRRGEFMTVPPREIDLMDVSPMQVISIAAGLIPFLEHDDANRALMGANMMRQGVPLLRAERPRVGTGLEGIAAADSCVTVLAEEDGIVAYVSATEVVVSKDGKCPAKVRKGEKVAGCRRYIFEKFRRSNAGTCVNQKPIVKVGQAVKKGQALADGPATDQGELALGKNLLVAFMPWRGFNFEDAILINERCVRDDTFTSVHIKDFECGARDTKLGPEQITRDIPNVGEDMLRNLGSDGVVRVGAEVRPGDILVGKITPKSETELAPEERLLRAIFGEKAADVRDTSLKVPPGTKGIVMDVRVTNSDAEAAAKARKSAKAITNALMDDEDNVESYLEESAMPEQADEIDARKADDVRKRREAHLQDEMVKEFSEKWLGQTFSYDIRNMDTQEVVIPKNKKITKSLLSKVSADCAHLQVVESDDDDAATRLQQQTTQAEIDEITDKFAPRFEELNMIGIEGMDDAGMLDEDRVVKQVRVFIAEKKNLSVGDKLAGRHGNKGVVSRILPDCDMPFLPDGRSVDIVLNPLGVPSRMNLGQLFETVLGGACSELDMHVKTPVFDGCLESEIDELLAKARQHQEENTMPGAVPWISSDGKSVLYDGLTGEPFGQRVVVGTIYMLKLHHLVTDKIHARATGPYSLVTQQPLGGKAQAGGQRMGEMEVWALEAYGVAYALQELLTVKSDDVVGRTRIYETIVKGTNTLEAGTPESFSVLVSELRGLCLDMR
ncbi:MAG: DNA-directed RNA polymerase subunit beta, partial [bacterium]|nr:DNA-directed RNA polymerase subunit beta [bacterium]